MPPYFCFHRAAGAVEERSLADTMLTGDLFDGLTGVLLVKDADDFGFGKGTFHFSSLLFSVN